MTVLSITERLVIERYRLLLAKDLSRGQPEKMARLSRTPLFEVAVSGLRYVESVPLVRVRRKAA